VTKANSMSVCCVHVQRWPAFEQKTILCNCVTCFESNS